MELDPEALRKSAEKRRTNTEFKAEEKLWNCEYCKRDFVREVMFMRHFCPAREKLDLLRSNIGQAAYQTYSIWMKLQKRSVQSIDKFSDSSYFRNFTEFVTWSQKLSLPKPESFIKLMVEADLKPSMWARSTSYELYLEWLDNAIPPEVQFIESLDYIKGIVDQKDFSNLYNEIGGNTIIKLIKNRKLSPWFLSTSSKFINWARQQAEVDDIVSALQPGTFAKKINANKELSDAFKEVHLLEGT